MAAFRREEFGHAGFHVDALTGVVALRGVQGDLAGGSELGGHLREVGADGLVLPDGLAEALALLGIGERIVEGGLPDAQGAGGNLDAPGLQALHHLGEALALDVAEQAVGGVW